MLCQQHCFVALQVVYVFMLPCHVHGVRTGTSYKVKSDFHGSQFRVPFPILLLLKRVNLATKKTWSDLCGSRRDAVSLVLMLTLTPSRRGPRSALCSAQSLDSGRWRRGVKVRTSDGVRPPSRSSISESSLLFLLLFLLAAQPGPGGVPSTIRARVLRWRVHVI